ncbi:carbohydrate ABC transporter permease [Candidatus Ventrimonas sp. KK005]
MKRNKVQVFDLVNNAILLLVALLCIYPFLYVFFVACSNGTYLQRGEVTFFPKGFNLEAFKYIMGNTKFHVWTGPRNSFLYTAGGTIVAVLTTYVTAYALSRERLKGRYFLMGAFIITWVFDAGIIPQYIIFSKLGFIDNPRVMIIPGAINTQFLIITKTFIEGIPKELDEAAVVDGANEWTILTKLYFPLSKTIMATIGTFYAVSIWNQYLLPQIYLKSDSLKVIQQVLKDVVIADAGTSTAFKNVMINGITLNQQNLKSAAIFVSMLPIVLVYPFVQKYFKKGIMVGAVKG